MRVASILDDTLSRLFSNQWCVLAGVSAILLILAWIGWGLGRIAFRRDSGAASGNSGVVQGAVLGLLGLLLGFSFAMAVGRFDMRKGLVLEEANSIGTTWLRADFLPAPQNAEIRRLLVDYTRLRLDNFSNDGAPERNVEFRAKVGDIQKKLWAAAAAAANANPSPLAAGFITSLNETIDLDATRMAALRNHVPSAVWLLLLVVTGCGAWSSGYCCGASGQRSAFSQYVFPVLVAVVITLIVDIDRPRKGIIGISQVPMKELLDSIAGGTPAGN